jgi:hypothetical protein
MLTVCTCVYVNCAACGDVIGTATTPNCYVYTGTMERCILSGTPYDFYEVKFGSVHTVTTLTCAFNCITGVRPVMHVSKVLDRRQLSSRR